MKKTLIFGLMAAFAMVSSAPASVITSDDFTYADGSLVPNGGWASHSGTPGDLLVSGGQAVVQHGAPSEDANLAFAAIPGVIYFGLDFSVGDLGAPYAGTDAEYFAHFKDAGFGFFARLDVSAPTGSGDFTVGIASDDSTADASWATDLTFGTTYRAIVAYDQTTDGSQLWIDPTSSGDTSIVGDADGTAGIISQFALRQSDSAENETVLVDNLIVATTFNEAAGIAIPEPGTASALALIAAAGVLRRRR